MELDRAMLTTRIIPCLDIDEGVVVKGIKFQKLRNAGDPAELAVAYYQGGADEIILLDVGATYKSRKIMIDIIRFVSQEIFIPLTVGGGIKSVADMREVLNAGADKGAVCSAALEDPALISNGAERFGSQCIVLSIDARRRGDTWYAFTYGGRSDTGREVVEWAKEGERLGAGEILLNSIDRDGTRQGYDITLLRRVSESVRIPVIASGGAGRLSHICDAIHIGKADAVLIASLLHYQEFSIQQIKSYLSRKGVRVRW